MKRFIKNIIYFIIPFIIYLIIIIIIDPYNYLNINKENNTNNNIAENIEPHLFRLIDFQNNPKKNIILGDSRSNGLFRNISSNNWSNLSCGGSSLKEIIQTFWWATSEKEQIDTIIIGISFNLYNKYNKRFWIEETLERKKNFFSYAFNKYTFQSTLSILKSYFVKVNIINKKQNLSKEEYWEYVINQVSAKFFEKYAYPEKYYQELNNISKYCIQNKIKLICWIPPTHIEFQNKIFDFNLKTNNSKFISDMKKIGELYNYNYINPLTIEKNNFGDPMHSRDTILKIIYSEIFNNKPYYAIHSQVQLTTTNKPNAR